MQMTGMKPKDMIELKEVPLVHGESYTPQDRLPEDGLYHYLLQPGQEHDDQCTQVQNGMGALINMQKSVILPLSDNYELYGHKILHIESFSAIEFENLVRISKFFI